MRDLNLAAQASLEGVHTELAGMGIPHISQCIYGPVVIVYQYTGWAVTHSRLCSCAAALLVSGPDVNFGSSRTHDLARDYCRPLEPKPRLLQRQWTT